MKKMLNTLKKKKGFTLVEVIIVLVILAILAAVLIPSLTGYIDKANEKASISNARNFVVAAQTIASEAYGEQSDWETYVQQETKAATAATQTTAATAATTSLVDRAIALAESPSTSSATVELNSKAKITKVVFCDGKYIVTYDGSKYSAVAGTTKQDGKTTVK